MYNAIERGGSMATIDDLKYLSERRLQAVEVLSKNNIHDIARQDSGYIVEFALKAAICKENGVQHYPSKFFSHRFDDLVKFAGLQEELSVKKATDKEFMKNWSIATTWSVELRYQPIGNDVSISRSFINAVKSDKGGVLPWVKTHW
jgi:hypothetical protein